MNAFGFHMPTRMATRGVSAASCGASAMFGTLRLRERVQMLLHGELALHLVKHVLFKAPQARASNPRRICERRI